MKNYLFLGALVTSIVFSSCNKELNHEQILDEDTVKVSLSVSDDAVASLKSAFDGEKVTLSGSENMSLFVHNGTNLTGPSGRVTNPFKATGSNKSYTFQCPAEMADKTWYPIFPYADAIVRLNSNGTSAYVRLSQVQFPGANTFDPQMDYILGRPFTPVEEGGNYTAEVTEVKRLFTPLRLDIKGLDAEDKISAVTIKFNKAVSADSKLISDALTGTFYVRLNESFNDARLDHIESYSGSNAVSAVYNTALEKLNDSWPVWFIVNPVTYSNGTNVELTVTTQNAMYTKSFDLTRDTEIRSNAINHMTINLSSVNRVFTENTISITAMGQYTKTGTADLTDASGNSAIWPMTATAYNTPDGTTVPRCIQLSSTSSVTFPDFQRKGIIKAYLYTYPFNLASNKTGHNYTFTLDGTNQYAYNLYNLPESAGIPASNLAANGGVLEISLAGEYLNGKSITSDESGNKMISAITLIMEDKTVTRTDYYADLTEGDGITIGDTTFTKADFTNIVLIQQNDGLNQTTIKPADGTIYFLDENVEITFTDHLKCTTPYYIVGRYANEQPIVNTDVKQIQIGNDVYFKNINIISKNANNVFQTGSLNSDCTANLVVEDCEVSCISSLIYDNNYSYSLESMLVKNCVIAQTATDNGKHFIRIQSANAENAEKPRTTKSIVLNNNVFIKNDSYAAQLVSYGNGNYADLNIDIQNNTLISILNTSLVQWVVAKAVTFRNNVGWANGNLAKDNGMYMVNAPNDANTPEGTYSYCSVQNNYFVNHGTAFLNNYSHRVSNMKGVVLSGNTFIKAAEATTQTDPVVTDTGIINYYPVKAVASGKGASYDTKLWMKDRIDQ